MDVLPGVLEQPPVQPPVTLQRLLDVPPQLLVDVDRGDLLQVQRVQRFRQVVDEGGGGVDRRRVLARQELSPYEVRARPVLRLWRAFICFALLPKVQVLRGVLLLHELSQLGPAPLVVHQQLEGNPPFREIRHLIGGFPGVGGCQEIVGGGVADAVERLRLLDRFVD